MWETPSGDGAELSHKKDILIISRKTLEINKINQLDPSPDVVGLFQNAQFPVKRFYPSVLLLSNQFGVMRCQLTAETQR